MPQADTESKDHQAGGMSRLQRMVEWVIAVVSALLIAGCLAFLVYDAASNGGAPPVLHVAVTDVEPAGDGYRILFEATNSGGETAAQVGVQGRLTRGGRVVEEASATIQFIPAQGSRRGALYFDHDPDDHQLVVDPTGFAFP